MNIIILTSSMADADFTEYASNALIKPNPSNQNFYNKLIRSLSLNNSVYAISLRPFCEGMFEGVKELEPKRGVDGTVPFYYAKSSTNKNYRTLKEHKDIAQLIETVAEEEELDSYIILVDTLRYNLVRAASLVRKDTGNKVIGIVTDNPQNLSNVKKSYVKRILKVNEDLDGYVCLTTRLNSIFNKKNAPSYIVEGLVENYPESKRLPISDYIFFGGALYERYGVKKLINAFHNIDANVNLVIAGNGELRHYINDMTEKDKRILYLSQVDKQMIYNLEQHSLLNVNPRPYSTTMDEESVPSKLIEYIASGAPTMSTVHTSIKSTFPDDVIWVESNSEEALRQALEDYLKTSDKSEYEKRAASARTRIYDLYGLNVQSESLTSFIHKIMFEDIN